VLQAVGGIELRVNGREVDPGQTLAYKGVMMSGVPNLAGVFGYTNASWTLKADLICEYVCRLLNVMDRKGARQVTPTARAEMPVGPFVERFTPGYILRAIASWPKQGSKPPWRVHQNYVRDLFTLKWSPADDDALEFANPEASSAAARAKA
jgi:hypothetical protein